MSLAIKKPLVIFVVGPTASGKSSLALALAQKCDGEIINADSVQVYDSLDIGSAKPSLEDQKKVKHHLIGHIAKKEKYNAGQFRKDVFEILKKRIAEGQNLFFVVGGSGFYLKALMTDLYKIPPVGLEIQQKIDALMPEERYEKLKILDPAYAAKISPNDPYRIQRALEVCLSTGSSFSSFQTDFSKKDFPYDYIKIGLRMPKPALRERVIMRTSMMLKMGWVEEVRALLNEKLTEWAALEAVGYREVKAFLKGDLPFEKLEDDIVRSTMALVKKQMTWFKKDSEIHWFDVGVDPEEVFALIQKSIV